MPHENVKVFTASHDSVLVDELTILDRVPRMISITQITQIGQRVVMELNSGQLLSKH